MSLFPLPPPELAGESDLFALMTASGCAAAESRAGMFCLECKAVAVVVNCSRVLLMMSTLSEIVNLAVSSSGVRGLWLV